MSDISAPRIADHWWWRPGWSVGTRWLTWHLTFDGQAPLHELAATYRQALEEFDCLTLVPDRWLHLTMQGLGDAAQIDPADIKAIGDAARPRLAAIPAFDLEFDRPVFTPEAIRWDAAGDGPAAVRNAIRDGIAEVWPEAPEPAEGFGAHVTIGYGNRDADARPVIEAINTVPSSPVSVRVTHADLILLDRDRRMYEWTTVESIPLGA